MYSGCTIYAQSTTLITQEPDDACAIANGGIITANSVVAKVSCISHSREVGGGVIGHGDKV